MQARKFLGKNPLQVGKGADLVVRDLGSEEHPAAPALLEELAQRGLVARIDIGGIEIIYAMRYGVNHFPLGLFLVDGAALARKAHAAVSEDGDTVPARRDGAILHGLV